MLLWRRQHARAKILDYELSLGDTLRPDGLGGNLDTASSRSMMTLLPWAMGIFK